MKMGHYGISYSFKSYSYVAQIQVDDTWIRLGPFVTAKEAAQAREDYIIEHELNHKRNFDAEGRWHGETDDDFWEV